MYSHVRVGAYYLLVRAEVTRGVARYSHIRVCDQMPLHHRG
jgi:hypothetical protein